MDNYNQMINNDYNNMVYSSTSGQPHPQQHELAPDATMLLQDNASGDKVQVNQYQERESIITNMSHQMDVYQQHNLQPHDALLIQNHQAQLQQTSVIQEPIEQNADENNQQMDNNEMEQIATSQALQHEITQDSNAPASETVQEAIEETIVEPKSDEVVDATSEVKEDDEMKGEKSTDGAIPEAPLQNEEVGEELTAEGEAELKEAEIKEDGDETLTEVKEENEGESSETKPTEEQVPPKPEEPKLDPEQCRVCTSKEDLVDIFQIRVDRPVAAIIKIICPSLNISERDSLPHKICNGCVEKVCIAYDFKKTAEQTDKELRSKLKRSQNKKRSTSDYVLIDPKVALLSSSEDDEELTRDDDDFCVSKSESVESDDDLSDFEPKKKKKKVSKKKKKPAKSAGKSSKSSGTRKSGRKRKQESSGASSKGFKANIVYIEAPLESDGNSNDEQPSKKRKGETKNGLPCPQCDRVLANSHGLREHLKSHSGDKFECKLCNKQFKLKLSLDAHMARHNEEKAKAEASKAKTTKPKSGTPVVKKIVTQKPAKPIKPLLMKKDVPKKKDPELSGRDLFKTCAPVTTTYWSDSFSD